MLQAPTMPDVYPPGCDLADPRTHLGDTAEFWRRLRAEHPVSWHPAVGDRPGFWVIASHRHNLAVYKDGARFTAGRGNMLLTLQNGGDPAGGRMVSVSEGGRHKDLRGAILKAFSPRALADVAVEIQRYTRGLVAEAVAAGGCDFAEDIAARIPINTICELLCVPAGDRDYLLRLNKQAVSADDEGQSSDEARMARNEIVVYLCDLVESRRGTAGEDVISVLANTVVDGRPLSGPDIALNCYSLLLGGDETSRFSMIAAVHALAAHPDQWAVLTRADTDLKTATEEVVRWATPIMHIGRTATADVDIADQTIRAGDIVTLWNSSANRDEAAFDHPDRFDLRRSPNKHLAFGFGSHFCVGVYLARVEIGALLDALRDTVAKVEAAGAPKPIYSNVLTGFSRLPVRLTPR